MTTATDKFICYRPNIEDEVEGKEIWAVYAREAAATYFGNLIEGYETSDEYSGLHIRVKHIETQMEYDFRVEVILEPVYYFNEIF